MAALELQDEQLVQRLQALAAQEERPLDDILQGMLEQYMSRKQAFETMEGMFDDDISDLSTSVRETITSYY